MPDSSYEVLAPAPPAQNIETSAKTSPGQANLAQLHAQQASQQQATAPVSVSGPAGMAFSAAANDASPPEAATNARTAASGRAREGVEPSSAAQRPSPAGKYDEFRGSRSDRRQSSERGSGGDGKVRERRRKRRGDSSSESQSVRRKRSARDAEDSDGSYSDHRDSERRRPASRRRRKRRSSSSSSESESDDSRGSTSRSRSPSRSRRRKRSSGQKKRRKSRSESSSESSPSRSRRGKRRATSLSTGSSQPSRRSRSKFSSVSPHDSRAAMGRRLMTGSEPWREPPPRELLPRGRDIRRDGFLPPQCPGPSYCGMPPNVFPPGWGGNQGPSACCSGGGPGSWPPHSDLDGYRGNMGGGPREAWHDPAMRNYLHEPNGAGHGCAASMDPSFATAQHRGAGGVMGGGMGRAGMERVGMDRTGFPGVRRDNRMNRNDGGGPHHVSPPGCGNNGMHQVGPTDYIPCASHSRAEPGYAGTATGGMGAGYSCCGAGGCAYSAGKRHRDERRNESIASCAPGDQANLAPRSAYDASWLPPATAPPAVADPPAQATDAAPGVTAGTQDALWTKFRQAVVEFAKPLLRGALHRPGSALGLPVSCLVSVPTHPPCSCWILSLAPIALVPPRVSPGPYERHEISKDGFKLILKKTSEKVVKSYQREGLPPPANSDIAENQRKKIERLVEEYVKFTQKEGAA